MYLPNDVARCADALEMNCQWRHNCKRWADRLPRNKEDEPYLTWIQFAKEVKLGKKCEYQLRIE